MTSLVLTTLADVEPQVPPVAPGLRKIVPYWYPYSTYAKERWIGREILEVVSTEFRDRSMEYYRYALESGVATLNRKPAQPDTIIQDGDLMENVVHRHEPPVTSTPVKVLFEDKEREFIVVNKPGSIPVHASGRYYRNTLVEILMTEFGFEKVYTVNRLDRLTSGLMILPTSTERARLLTKEFMDGSIKKEYVARCKGEFPEEEIICEEPLLTIDRQMGLNVVHPEGKAAKTVFNRIRYDPKTDSSVVLCKPMTGRSHQIRVHLQYLGHPVANDPVYSETRIWGTSLGRGGVNLTPSDERSAPAPPPHLKDSTELGGSPESLAKDGTSSASASEPKLLPRETGKDIGMGSPVPLSSEAVGVITRLRNMKDESEDWSRWRDVVFRAKEPLRPQHWALKPPPPRNKKKKGKSEFVDETLNVFRSGTSPATPVTPTTPDDAIPVSDAPQLSVDEAVERAQGLAPVVQTPLVEAGQHYCPECYLPLHPDPKPEKLYIFLHALRYTTSLGAFETEMPEWSAPDWDWDRSSS